MRDSMPFRGIRGGLVALAAVGAMTLLAACGGAGAGDSASPGAAVDSASVEEAKSLVATAQQQVAWPQPGPPAFDASAARGKTLGWVAITASNPFSQIMLEGAREAAQLSGLSIDYCDGKGRPSEWVRCADSLIAKGVDALLIQSIDPKILSASIEAANRAGIPVIETSSNDSSQPPTPGVSAANNFAIAEMGKLLADYAIADSNGRVNAVYYGAPEVALSPPLHAAIEAEFARLCPATCSLKSSDVPVGEWDTRLPTVVQSGISADRTINYLIPLADGAVPAMIPAVHAANATDRVKILSITASPSIVKFIESGDVFVADVGPSTEWHGWSTVDQALRLIVGQPKGSPILHDPQMPIRLFDKANVGELNFDDPRMPNFFGPVDLAAEYGRVWGITQ